MKDQDEKIVDNQPAEEENINKIRDILFGSNISEFEKRFKELEANFNQKNEKLSEEIQDKVAHLQNHFQNEVNNLVNQLKSEREENQKAFEEIIKKNEIQVNEFKNYKNEILETHREIRKTQLEQFGELKQNVNNVEKDLKNSLAEEAEKLAFNKVDRKTLAILLSELALKLNDNETTP